MHQRLEQAIGADVLGSGGAEHRHDRTRTDGGTQSRHQFVVAERPLVEEPRHQVVVGFRDQFHQRFPGVLRFGRDAFRNGDWLAASGAALVGVGPLGNQVDDAAEALFLAVRQLHRHEGPAEGGMQVLEGGRKAGALAIQAVDDHELRQVLVVGQGPDAFGLHFHTSHGVDDDEGGVGHPQRRARFAQEVAEAGRVDEVDLRAVPVEPGRRRGQRVLADDGLFVEVGRRRPVVDASQAGRGSRGEQQRGDELGLAGAVVADDCHVANGRRCIGGHEHPRRS